MLYRCFFSHSASWLKKDGFIYRLMLVCAFPQLDLVPLYASQQTSRSLSLVCLTFSLSLSRALASSLCNITHTTLLLAVRAETALFYSKNHTDVFSIPPTRIPTPSYRLFRTSSGGVCATFRKEMLFVQVLLEVGFQQF